MEKNENMENCYSDWKFIQQNYISILSQIILKLLRSEFVEKNFPKTSGIYLIYKNNSPDYIGESNNIDKRIKQHKKEKYKDDDFIKIKIFETKIGRKEIEAFGIVNIPFIKNENGKLIFDEKNIQTLKNKNKKSDYNKINILKYANKIDIGKILKNWENLLSEGEKIFEKVIENLEKPKKKTKGIYSYKEEEEIIYVGETSNILERSETHSKQTTFSALRRSIGKSEFEFKLKEEENENGDVKKKKNFSKEENGKITEYLKKCSFKFLEVNFGRVELEELLIKKNQPKFNIKSK
jgi:predicted GIY-YIG superfamily endonuclease